MRPRCSRSARSNGAAIAARRSRGDHSRPATGVLSTSCSERLFHALRLRLIASWRVRFSTCDGFGRDTATLMKITLVTIFPEFFPQAFADGMIRVAREKGRLD